jgi:hypothetical protein
MARIRKTRIVMNPAGRPLKEVSKISDRAKRYRANKVGAHGRKRCNYCGSVKNVGVDHVNGNESDYAAKNLVWACKACNTRKGLLFRRKGLGVITSQSNPSRSRGGKAQMDAYAAAIKVMRGDFEGDVSKAVATIRATPPAVRSAYTSRTWSMRRQIYGPAGRQMSLSEVPF